MMVTLKIGSTNVNLIALFSLVFCPFATASNIANHQFDIGFRPRIAYVKAHNDARSTSLLFRFLASSEWTAKFSSLVEIDYVKLGWQEQFSNGEHFNGNPVIADTAGVDLNQLFLKYSLNNTTQLLIGREVVNLGNERFVGSNSFWQNEQSLDVAGLKYSFGSASYFRYRYLMNANRISGDDAGSKLRPSDSNYVENNGQRPARFLGDHEHDSHLLFSEFKEWDNVILQVYYYDMNIKNALPLSNRTLGLRSEFKGRIENVRSFLHAEFALQDRPKVAKNKLVQYYNIGAGLGYRSSEMSLNFELLGENDNISFATPLASLHDHNGWADKFLVTPAVGLRDYSTQYIWRNNPYKIDVRYHFFHAAKNNVSLGKELDIDFSIKFSRQSTLLFRFADFYAQDDSYQNEQRFFVQYLYHL